MAWREAVSRDPSWEPLLDPQVCDAVLVGVDGWNDARAEGVRALVQAGRTLLLSHPLVLSMLWAYELDMIRGDSGARLIPFLPDRLHPFIRRLQERIEAGLAGAGPLGAVETITMERRLLDRSRDAVLRALAVDVDLDAELVERYDELVPVLMGVEEGHAPRQLCNYFLNENNVRAFLETEAG